MPRRPCLRRGVRVVVYVDALANQATPRIIRDLLAASQHDAALMVTANFTGANVVLHLLAVPRVARLPTTVPAPWPRPEVLAAAVPSRRCARAIWSLASRGLGLHLSLLALEIFELVEDLLKDLSRWLCLDLR